jgi:hypothetical protein
MRHLPRKAAAPIDIQFLRGPRLYGLEVGKATRLLEGIIAYHKCSSVRKNACLLLNGIKQGREIFDEYPLISERGRQEQSPPIYIHDAILSEIENVIKTAYRAKGGFDD